MTKRTSAKTNRGTRETRPNVTDVKHALMDEEQDPSTAPSGAFARIPFRFRKQNLAIRHKNTAEMTVKLACRERDVRRRSREDRAVQRGTQLQPRWTAGASSRDLPQPATSR